MKRLEIVIRPEKLEELKTAKDLYSVIVDRGDPVALCDLAISGREVMEAGVTPGKAVGEALNSLLNDVLDDPALNTREELIRRAERLGGKSEKQ